MRINIVWRKLTIGLIGMILLTLGLNILNFTRLGLSSFDTLANTLGNILNLSLGNTSFIIQITLLIIATIIYKFPNNEKVISIIVVFFSTQMTNVFEILLSRNQISNLITNLPYPFFVLGFLIFGLGIYLMIQSEIMRTPLDWFIVALAAVGKIKIGTSKFVSEVLFLGLSFILAYIFNVEIVVGIGTVTIVLLLGPYLNVIESVWKKIIN